VEWRAGAARLLIASTDSTSRITTSPNAKILQNMGGLMARLTLMSGEGFQPMKSTFTGGLICFFQEKMSEKIFEIVHEEKLFSRWGSRTFDFFLDSLPALDPCLPLMAG
jgi:hypothetical protein